MFPLCVCACACVRRALLAHIICCFVQEDLRVEHELAIETAKAEIERDAAVETAKIEAEARIRQERENEDVQTRKLQAQWEADKEKVCACMRACVALQSFFVDV